MRQAGQARERLRRNKLGFAAKLHGADHRGQVHIAAALARADQCALHLHCAGQNRRARVGHAQAAIGVAVKSETRAGKIAHQPVNHLLPLLPGSTPPLVSHTTMRLTFWRTHCSVSLAEMVEAALAEIRSRRGCRFRTGRNWRPWRAPDRRRPQGRCVQAVDGLPRHEQIFFRRRSERPLHIEQPRLHHHHRDGNRRLWRTMNCTSGQSSTFAPRPRVRPNRASFIAPRYPTTMRERRQIADKLVGAGESDLGIAHAKRRHALQAGARHWAPRFPDPAVAVRRAELVSNSSTFLMFFVCHLFLQSIAFPQVFLRVGPERPHVTIISWLRISGTPTSAAGPKRCGSGGMWL